jgi:hypothetical protein
LYFLLKYVEFVEEQHERCFLEINTASSRIGNGKIIAEENRQIEMDVC